jgi:hypothetical protein
MPEPKKEQDELRNKAIKEAEKNSDDNFEKDRQRADQAEANLRKASRTGQDFPPRRPS